MKGWSVVGAALLLAAGCGKKELVCPATQVACGGTCVDLAADAAHCGACGTACPGGEVCQAGVCSQCSAACHSARGCRAGACQPDVLVSCFSTGDVQPLDGDLAAAGPPRATDAGPVALANLGDRTWVAHSQGTGAHAPLVGLASDPAAAPLRFALGGSQLQKVRAAGGLLFVSDAGSQNLVVVNPASGVVDDVPLGRSAGNYENPSGIAVVGARVYVALQGDAAAGRASFAYGQQVAVVTLAATFCPSPPCSTVTSRISLDLPGAYDPGGLPYPSDAVAVGTRVFVSLANLKLGSFGFFTDPAGNGRLLVIDTAAGDATSVVDLGAGCTNPGALAVSGSTLLVSCGGTSALAAVELSGAAPALLRTIAAGVVSGGVAVCGGRGYVTDQFSGRVAPFDLAAAQAGAAVDICPVPSPGGFAWASDVTCAP